MMEWRMMVGDELSLTTMKNDDETMTTPLLALVE